ncbi:MAG: hypothetical protein MJZ29_05860 [Bacteroidaceae bacterium]|nr:hypothetical protein [Bacteroidaceae bacterium]
MKLAKISISGTRITDMRFSHYPKGYINKKGQAVLSVHPSEPSWTILDAFAYITSNAATDATEGIRELVNKRADIKNPTKQENDAEQRFKKLNFEIATFSGIFHYRKADSILERSMFVTIDLDHLGTKEDVERIKSQITKDTWLVSALCFTSPRGDGLKNIAVVPEQWQQISHRDMYLEVRKYVLFEYGVLVDDSGSDIGRACYLPYDPECYINPMFKKSNTIK